MPIPEFRERFSGSALRRANSRLSHLLVFRQAPESPFIFLFPNIIRIARTFFCKRIPNYLTVIPVKIMFVHIFKSNVYSFRDIGIAIDSTYFLPVKDSIA